MPLLGAVCKYQLVETAQTGKFSSLFKLGKVPSPVILRDQCSSITLHCYLCFTDYCLVLMHHRCRVAEAVVPKADRGVCEEIIIYVKCQTIQPSKLVRGILMWQALSPQWGFDWPDFDIPKHMNLSKSGDWADEQPPWGFKWLSISKSVSPLYPLSGPEVSERTCRYLAPSWCQQPCRSLADTYSLEILALGMLA